MQPAALHSGEFKLADLGLGVRMKEADRGSDNQYSMTTFAGYGVNVQMQGRPPEVLQGDALTSAVDVWSLGCLIYSVFTVGLCTLNQVDP
jgi:serine/threonine protein kinase